MSTQVSGDTTLEYLVMFQYHDPDSLALYNRGVLEDFESTTGVFIRASSPQQAVAWCETIAQEFLCRCNGDRPLDWMQSGYHCWIEPHPEESSWSHCLDFFQRTKVAEMPEFGKMGSAAYDAWQQRQH